MSIVASFAPGAEGEAAIATAVRCVEELGGPLIVVATVPLAGGEASIDDLVSGVDDARVVQVEEGQDAVEVILDQIDDHNARILVLGLRQRTAVGKLILGGSAQRLLLDAPCPVLTVKPA